MQHESAVCNITNYLLTIRSFMEMLLHSNGNFNYDARMCRLLFCGSFFSIVFSIVSGKCDSFIWTGIRLKRIVPIQIGYQIKELLLRFDGNFRKQAGQMEEILRAEMNVSLNPYVIGLLNKHDIHEINEFLCCDSAKLMSITNIGMQTAKYWVASNWISIDLLEIRYRFI